MHKMAGSLTDHGLEKQRDPEYCAASESKLSQIIYDQLTLISETALRNVLLMPMLSPRSNKLRAMLSMGECCLWKLGLPFGPDEPSDGEIW